jgi:hypothetical protein
VAAPAHHPSTDRLVTNCNDLGAGSLRQAFADALAGDVIVFADPLPCSTITLASGSIAAAVPDLTVQGPGRDVLTIDGGAASRVFYSSYGLSINDVTVANGVDLFGAGGCVLVREDLHLTRSTVSGCVVGTGAFPYGSGGAVSVGGDLFLESSTLRDNSAAGGVTALGGAAYVGGNLSMIDSIISGSSTTSATQGSEGGGAWVAGNITLVDSLVWNNSASSTNGYAFGGGLTGRSGVNLQHSLVLENRAQSTNGDMALGGGIFGYDGAIVITDNSQVSRNTASSSTYWSGGGGVAGGFTPPGGSITLLDSTISDNTASANCSGCFVIGGGAASFSSITVLNSTVSGNRALTMPEQVNAHAAGGGLATYALGAAGSISVVNSTISGNSAIGSTGATGYGGGLAAMDDSPLQIANSTIAFNNASSFGGGATGSGDTGVAPQIRSSIIADNTAPAAADLAPNASSNPFVANGTHNLVMSWSANIAFADEAPLTDTPILLPLADNGGGRATHALAACSPAVDTGSNDDMLPFDGRGAPFMREYGSAADIGAFELQPDTDRIFFGDFEVLPCQSGA